MKYIPYYLASIRNQKSAIHTPPPTLHCHHPPTTPKKNKSHLNNDYPNKILENQIDS